MKKKDNTSVGEVNANIYLELEYKWVEFLFPKFN